MASYKLNWKDKEVAGQCEGVGSLFLEQFGLAVEGSAKEQLYWGHGMRTGTLRRSIHSAAPGYNWPGDNLKPSEESPERGGQAVSPGKVGEKLVLQVGSGMIYADVIERLYHYMETGLRINLDHVPRILKWAAAQKGLL